MSFIETSSAPNDPIRPHFILRVLGSSAELLVDGTPHSFTNSKHLAILAYLTLEPGEYGREQLTRFVWSSGAAGSIDNAISELRGALGSGVIPHRARKIALDPQLLYVDALQLLSAVDDPKARPLAIELYRGAFLEGFKTRGSAESFVRWIEKTRARLEEAFRQLCDEECHAAAFSNDWKRVQSVAQLGMRKSPGWVGGERWRHVAQQALRVRPVDVPPTEEVLGRAKEIGTDDPTTTAEITSPRAEFDVQRFRSLRPAVAGVVAAFLIVLVILVIRGWPESSIRLVQMPAVRAEDLPAPGSPVNTISDWLRTDGSWIYYRYEHYLPAACRHPTQAIGNFSGWTDGIPVVCLNAAWLAVDGQRLIEHFSLAPETTYCLQFLYIEGRTSFWGLHGAEGAPGLDSIRVVAPGGSYNIGFAIVRRGPGQHSVELTQRYPAPRC